MVHCLPRIASRNAIFSACTWFEDPLRQLLKEDDFEMAVLLSVNKALFCVEVPSEDDAEKIIVESVVTKFKSNSDTNLLEEN